MGLIDYPSIPRDETIVDDYHGQKINDPYRALEDPDADVTKALVDAENTITNAYIGSCVDREQIKTELTELWDYAKYGCPHKEGDKYYFSKNSGLQNQSVLYVQDSLEAEPKVFLDPNSFSEDGTVSLKATKWSKDGSVMAYSVSKSGSDWATIKFMNVETREDYPETLEKVKFSGISWTHDNKGIFYSCYPLHDLDCTTGTDTQSIEHQKLYYHVLGTSQDQDVMCVEFPEEPKWMSSGEVSDCGKYLFISTSKDCKYNLLHFCDLEAEAKDGIKTKFELTALVPLVFDADYDYITNLGSKVILQTNKDAKNFKLVSLDLDNLAAPWQDFLPEHSKDVLEWASGVAGDKLVTCYMHDVKNTMQLRKLEDGEVIHNFELEIGSITGFSGDIRHTELMYKYSSQIAPGTIFHVDLSTPSPTQRVLIQTEVNNFDPADFKVEQVFFPSKDGTKIPMFITMRKDFVPDGTSPCLLYGYGGFSISLTPSFSITNTYFVQHFGISAIANMRGGGEYGEAWNNAGRKENLQNCLTDFQCAAEYLVKEKYTCSPKLTIFGGSHGGMLVGACTNQRPELYGASVAAVGVMDMLRFHKFTVGYAWTSNYGCSDNKEEYQNLRNISPLHNIKVPESGQYPAVLLLTADHDDRVVPAHTLKYIATLQQTVGNSEKQDKPLLVRVDTKAGHGAGRPSYKVIAEYTDLFSFLVKAIDIKYLKYIKK